MNMMTDNEYMPLDASSQPSQNDQEERQGEKKKRLPLFFFFFFLPKWMREQHTATERGRVILLRVEWWRLEDKVKVRFRQYPVTL